MNLVRGYGANSNSNIKIRHSHVVGLNPDSVLVVKLPDSRILLIVSRSLFLAIVILALPWLGSFLRDAEGHCASPRDILPIVFQDLVDQGFLKNGQKGLLLSTEIGDRLWFMNDRGIDLVTVSNSDPQTEIPNERFDFVFASSSENANFINRITELDGIVVMPMDPSYEFLEQLNYKIIYLRHFYLTDVIAMRKISSEEEVGVLV